MFSSRRLTRATYRDVAVPYLMANTRPDPDTMGAFGPRNLDGITAAFVDALELARELKLLQLGIVSLVRHADQRERFQGPERNLRARPGAAQADQADAPARPAAITQGIARRVKPLAKMDAACAQLKARARAEQERAEYESKLAAREQREGSAKGPAPQPPSDTPTPDEQINLTGRAAHAQKQTRRLYAKLQRAGRG